MPADPPAATADARSRSTVARRQNPPDAPRRFLFIMHGPLSLLFQRRFGPFFITQFLGAFNDNLFKNALIVLLTFRTAEWTTLSPGLLANLAAGLFILPFFIFSATAGQLADKYDKARLARVVKLLEMGIMALAAIGFVLKALPWLLAALFLLGLHSTLFGPVKYAILPQHLPPEALIAGNALVEAGTFIAILTGTLAGALLAGSIDAPVWIAIAGFAVALAGYLASRQVPAAAPSAPGITVHLNPLTETVHNLALLRQHPALAIAMIGLSWFWLYGALFLTQFPIYAQTVLGGDAHAVTLLLATFTVGIGAGSLLCERLSGPRLRPGLVAPGALGLSLAALDLWFASPAPAAQATPLPLAALLVEPAVWRVLADLLLLGLCGGLFTVPLYAQLQIHSPATCRARLIAANNILNALFMVVGALAAAALLGQGWSIPALFALAAGANAAVAAFMCWHEPAYRWCIRAGQQR